MRTVGTFWVLSIVLLVVLCPQRAVANFEYFFGAGLPNIAKAGGIDHVSGSFQGYLNPGFASFAPPTVALSFVVHWASLNPLKNIRLQSPSYPHAESLPTWGDFSFSAHTLPGIQVSVSLPVFGILASRRFRFHFVGFVPLSDTLRLEAKSSFLPSYVFYEGRNHHTVGHFSFSGIVIPDLLGVGAGLTLTMRAVSSVKLTLSSVTQGSASSSIRVGPGLSWFGGVYLHPTSWLHTSVSIYGPEYWDVKLNADSNLRVLDPVSIKLHVLGHSMFNFLPLRVIWGSSVRVLQDLWWSFQLGWHHWARYKTHRMKIELFDSGPLDFPSVPTRDIWTVRTGLSWHLHPRWWIHSGVAYVPTMIRGFEGPHNDLDANRVVLGAGVSFKMPSFLGDPDSSVSFGLFGQVHWLLSKTISKHQSNTIGAPRFDLGGTVFVVGSQLSVGI